VIVAAADLEAVVAEVAAIVEAAMVAVMVDKPISLPDLETGLVL